MRMYLKKLLKSQRNMSKDVFYQEKDYESIKALNKDILIL